MVPGLLEQQQGLGLEVLMCFEVGLGMEETGQISLNWDTEQAPPGLTEWLPAAGLGLHPAAFSLLPPIAVSLIWCWVRLGSSSLLGQEGIIPIRKAPRTCQAQSMLIP